MNSLAIAAAGLAELRELCGDAALRAAIADAGLDRAATSAEPGAPTPEEKALAFVLDLVRGDRRTAVSRLLVLRFLFDIDPAGLASIAAYLGVSRVRIGQVRDALVSRLALRGVRVRRRERLPP